MELLNNAVLKLKAGACYALIGRNGTGKSTLLKAIAEKLIPGIPRETRISLLQQTIGGQGAEDDDRKDEVKLSVLEGVIDRATARNEVQREIDGTLIYL